MRIKVDKFDDNLILIYNTLSKYMNNQTQKQLEKSLNELIILEILKLQK